MTIDPNAPAFPHVADIIQQGENTFLKKSLTSNGLTIRAHFAAMAMQGLAANHQFLLAVLQCSKVTNGKPETVLAQSAIEHADALIAELNKPTQ